MRILSGMMTAFAALGMAAFSAPAAHAASGEYCITYQDSTHSCLFDTMEQCKASAAGGMYTCARDPFYNNASSLSVDQQANPDAKAQRPKTAQKPARPAN